MKSVNFAAGNLKGAKFYLADGEGFPFHNHTQENAHLMIVCSGRIKVTREVEKGQYEMSEYEPGRAIHFEPGCSHSVRAIENDTVIYNLLTGG